MRRIHWYRITFVGIGVMLGLLFGVAVKTSFAQGQRFVVFEAFLRDT